MRSRCRILAMSLVLPIAACQPAATPGPTFTSDDEAAIRTLLDSYLATVLAEDWAANAQYYAPDAVRMPPDVPMVQGHDAIIAFGEAYPTITAHTITPEVIEGDGNLAYARGSYTITVTAPSGESVDAVGKWQAIYQRQADGSWRCVSDIWNNDMPVVM